MPSGFAALDTGFPQLSGIDGTEAKLLALQDYLALLLEQLRYTLHNLGVENLNTTEVKGWMGEIISEPLKIAIEDAEAGLSARIDVNAEAISSEVSRATGAEGTLSSRITQTAEAVTSEVTRATGAETALSSRITQTADAVTAEVTRATGAESVLRQTADGISTRVTTAEGNISTLNQTAAGLRTDVNAAAGAASTAQQTADAIKAQVTDGSGSYTVVNLRSDGLHIGSASGTTKIDGGSIAAGTVTANELAAGAVTTDKLEAGAVTAAKISSGYVYGGSISADQITSGSIDADYVSVSGLLGVYYGGALVGYIGGGTGSAGSGTTYGTKLVGSNVNNYAFASGGGAGLFSFGNSIYVTPTQVAANVGGTIINLKTLYDDVQALKNK